jgi:hypothetical protein
MIPAFLSIDVEPEPFQLSASAPPPWSGFEAILPLIERLRERLERLHGKAPRFGWYFRTDPQIAQVYGRADHFMHAHAAVIERLAKAGDYFGVHMHTIRWSDAHAAWVHDFADPAWLDQCTRASLDAFAEWAGTPARHLRSGAGFLSNEIVAAAEQCGVRLEMTLEPGAGWGGLQAREVPTAVDSSPIVGPYCDCRAAPREVYRPSARDYRTADAQGREILVVPLSTFRDVHDGRVRVFYPTEAWRSRVQLWNLLEERLAEMRRPYVSLAIRTDAQAERLTQRVWAIVDALATHPIARRLRFVDPLAAAPGLLATAVPS